MTKYTTPDWSDPENLRALQPWDGRMFKVEVIDAGPFITNVRILERHQAFKSGSFGGNINRGFYSADGYFFATTDKDYLRIVSLVEETKLPSFTIEELRAELAKREEQEKLPTLATLVWREEYALHYAEYCDPQYAIEARKGEMDRDNLASIARLTAALTKLVPQIDWNAKGEG